MEEEIYLCADCGDEMEEGDLIVCSCGDPVCEVCYYEHGHINHDTNPDNRWFKELLDGDGRSDR